MDDVEEEAQLSVREMFQKRRETHPALGESREPGVDTWEPLWDWVFADDVYQSWQKNDSKWMLRCVGGPGSGKVCVFPASTTFLFVCVRMFPVLSSHFLQAACRSLQVCMKFMDLQIVPKGVQMPRLLVVRYATNPLRTPPGRRDSCADAHVPLVFLGWLT